MSTPADPPLSRRAARLAEQGAQPDAFARPEQHGRRGSTPISVPSSAPTDVSYRTQVRPRVPHYDGPPPSGPPAATANPTQPTRHLDSSASPPLVPPTTVAPPAPLAPSATDRPMRRRDFRPPADAPAPQAPAADSTAASDFDIALEYRTQLVARSDAPATAPSRPPVEQAHVIDLPLAPLAGQPTATPAEQTLSRRELRALREQHSPGAESAPEALRDGDARVVPPPAAQEPVVPPPAAHAPILPPAAHAPILPPPVAPTTPAPLVEPAAPTTATGGASLGSAPTGGHWSVGIDVDDDPFENTFSRQVGSPATTSTSALVLPEMPTGSIAGPVAGTGEIIITGMIDLPRTVSSTGTVPTVHESPDIDDLFDAAELTPAPPDAAPVSASRAVSSHTQGHSIIAPRSRRPSTNTVTTVLVAATVVMALVAIGLFVVAAVNGLF